jgi:hypothetical protein
MYLINVFLVYDMEFLCFQSTHLWATSIGILVDDICELLEQCIDPCDDVLHTKCNRHAHQLTYWYHWEARPTELETFRLAFYWSVAHEQKQLSQPH